MVKPKLPSLKAKKEVFGAVLHEEDIDKSLSYINITLLDCSEAVKEKLKAKIVLPERAFVLKKLAGGVTEAVSKSVPPSSIAKTLSAKLPKMLMYKMHQKAGMKVAAQTVFVEDNYIVIQIQVQHVNLEKLLQNARVGPSEDSDDDIDDSVVDAWIAEQARLVEEETSSSKVSQIASSELSGESWKDRFLNFVEWALSNVVPVTIHRNLEDERLPKLVQAKLTDQMNTMLKQKLESKKMKAESVVLPQEEQARYFYSHLNAVRELANGTG